LAGGERHVLSPKLFAVYRLLATARAERWPIPPGREPRSSDRIGWLSFDIICDGRTPTGGRIDALILRFLQDAVAAVGGDTADAGIVEVWRKTVVEQSGATPADKRENVQRNLAPSLDRAADELRAWLGPAAETILWRSEGKPARFGLLLAPGRVIIR
jgi:hypothetical protein